jgi:hypothetical protein
MTESRTKQAQRNTYCIITSPYIIAMPQTSSILEKRPWCLFHTSGSSISHHSIDSDEGRFYIILAVIEELSVLALVFDCIRNSPAQDKYQSFKTQLIACLTDSKEHQLYRLLTKLDDKKPSQLLQEMRNLASHGISEDVLHSLWMKRRPIHVRCVLSTNDRVKLSKLAKNCWPEPCSQHAISSHGHEQPM